MFANRPPSPGSRAGRRPELPARIAEDDVDSREALELAGLVHEIARRGESERTACRAILAGFAEYLLTRT